MEDSVLVPFLIICLSFVIGSAYGQFIQRHRIVKWLQRYPKTERIFPAHLANALVRGEDYLDESVAP